MGIEGIEKMNKKIKLYCVHRCGWENGGTQHWITPPISKREADMIAMKWRDPSYIPTDDEYVMGCPSSQRKTTKMDKIEYVKIAQYMEPINWSDGKMRQVTVKNIKYFYQTIENGNTRITTILNFAKTPIYRYSGDPHDYMRSGVIRIIREEGL